MKREKIKIKVSFPFNGIFGHDIEYFCPNCNDRILKNAQKCDIISASLTKGCGCVFDWNNEPD